MQNYDEYIGKHIREVRYEKGLSQQAVADKCGFANTVLSAYENGKKIPNLTTIATIARSLNVSIERLYYGDDNNSFINTVPDAGRKIVNSIYLLWDLDVIYFYEGIGMYDDYYDGGKKGKQSMSLSIKNYTQSIRRLINGLNEFKERKETYDDPDTYLEMLLSSVAKEINNQIVNDKKEMENIKDKSSKK